MGSRATPLGILILLVLIATPGYGTSEVQCQTPHFRVTPNSVRAGEDLTAFSPFALFACPGEPNRPSSVVLDISTFSRQMSGEEAMPPVHIVAEGWAIVELGDDAQSVTVTGRVPSDLPPGQYFLVVEGSEILFSDTFTVLS